MKVKTLQLFLISFCLFFPAAAPSATARVSGEAVFVEGRCVRCHTLGRGRFVGPDLLGAGKKYSRDDLIKWAQNPEGIYAEKNKKPINEGYPPMPPTDLSQSKAHAVVDYLLNYKSPSGLSQSGTIQGRVRNVTTGEPEAGQDIALVSYTGDRPQDRYFAKSDPAGNFSFSSLKWDRSYEVTLFHKAVQYVSGKIVFLPGEDRITLDLPVYDTTSSDENISLRSLNLIIYPDDAGENVNVTSLYVFENSGETAFTGEQTDSGAETLVFSIPEEAVNLTFSGGVSTDAVQRKEKKLYSRLPFLPGMKRIALGYSLSLSEIRGNFHIGLDYEVADLGVFVRKTEHKIRLEQPEGTAEDIMIHDEAFLKYELSDVKLGDITVAVSGASFFNTNLTRYLPAILFFAFVAAGVIYFFIRRKRFSG